MSGCLDSRNANPLGGRREYDHEFLDQRTLTLKSVDIFSKVCNKLSGALNVTLLWFVVCLAVKTTSVLAMSRCGCPTKNDLEDNYDAKS